ncbi:hypothetical protein DW724_12600 [Butyricicoccus sp. AM27-36]|nr:hypothetical protein DW724_12600 [Butyricicoccus sp. AM27-36]
MLSRNHGSAGKQERTAGCSKVVRKFPYGNFLPLKVKNPALSLRGFSAALRRYMLLDFWNLHGKFY